MRARHSLNQGLLALSEGDWPRAEKLLVEHADDSESPLLNYLAAARAAQDQGRMPAANQYASGPIRPCRIPTRRR
ncbi:heme biosynthesis HemY N-terminal domain-containing protein [Thiohalobacter thiocyanaticus]|uniref:heme biosynthesis HemY N-terminal domain-containing protein n=1 Tax=Thiohalobacter thiocyanaticus TaxID=585455 RepID=UPI0037DC11DE